MTTAISTRFRREAETFALALRSVQREELRLPMAPRCPSLGERPQRRGLAAIRTREARMVVWMAETPQRGQESQETAILDLQDQVKTLESEVWQQKTYVRRQEQVITQLQAQVAEFERKEFVRQAARGGRVVREHSGHALIATVDTIPDEIGVVPSGETRRSIR